MGNVYLGRIDHIVKNLNAAFVKISNDNMGYLSLKNVNSSCVMNRTISEGQALRAGDEVIVQVESEAVKTKKTKLTTNICISGKYTVVTLGKQGVGCSMKLEDDLRLKLVEMVKDRLQHATDWVSDDILKSGFGVIIRTDAAALKNEEAADILLADIKENLNKITDLLKEGKTRAIYSALIDKSKDEDLLEHHIAKAENYLKLHGIADYEIKEDSGIWGISSKIDELFKNRVWLKSGAYLIIEQLESFNAIDVNTGKAIAGKNDISEKVNLEATKEIMRQIRLRNLTGMILIDFINMKSEEANQKLIETMKELCRKDPVHTSFIDVTGLGIMELIRNKNDKSLKEIISQNNKE
jgi:ribonuclease G